MNLENKIGIVDDVSDIFLEISKYFSVELQVADSGYGINIEKDYDKVVGILKNPGYKRMFDSQIRFKLVSRWAVKNDWDNKRKQSLLKKTTKYLINTLPNIQERLSVILDDYDVTYPSKIVVISPKEGLIILPLMEDDKDTIAEDSKTRMNANGIDFTSYENNIDEISSDDIKVGHVHINFLVSEKATKKKEPESKSKFSKIISKFNVFKKS